MTDEPASTTAWARGAAGERKVGAVLDTLRGSGAVVLHDRRIPGSRANIDHVVVARSGVWVIDTKRYRGQVARRDVGGWFTTDVRLMVGRRDCTALVAAMGRQVKAARHALGASRAAVPVHPVLCFVDAEWGWFSRPFTVDGVTVAWPKATARMIDGDGPVLEADTVAEVATRLAAHLPPVR